MNILPSYLSLTRLKKLYTEYERYLIPGVLLFGFLSDLIFFSLISFDTAIFALSIHLMIVALGIALINFYEDGYLRGNFWGYLRLAAPLALQFSFGALFSSFVIFYSFSGSIFASWPFLAVLVFLMVANEIFKKYNTRPEIQIGVFFFALFSFFNLSIPYLILDLGPEVFFASGNIALLIVGLFTWGLFKYSPRVKRTKTTIISSIAGIFIAMNIFYLTNVIPPIPLTIRDIGVYYHVERIEDKYSLTDKKGFFFEPIIEILPFVHKTLPLYNTRRAYVFSSVFAPPGMTIDVIHEWQFLDSQKGWITKNRIPFTISGGRKEGFRGFSNVSNLQEGKWRVNVRTETNQIVGRYTFNISIANSPPTYKIEVK